MTNINKIIPVLSLMWSVHWNFYQSAEDLVLKQSCIPILFLFSAYALSFLACVCNSLKWSLSKFSLPQSAMFLFLFWFNSLMSSAQTYYCGENFNNLNIVFCFILFCFSFLHTVPKTPPANVSGRSGRRHELVIAWEVRDFSVYRFCLMLTSLRTK